MGPRPPVPTGLPNVSERTLPANSTPEQPPDPRPGKHAELARRLARCLGMPRSCVIVVLVLGASGRIAVADQCQYVSPEEARQAEVVLAGAPRVVELCEPCGQVVPVGPSRVDTLAVTIPVADMREIHINGRPVDLAYLYVQRGPVRYENVARLVACSAEGVSDHLEIPAFDEPAVPLPVAAAAVPAAPPPPEPAPAAAPPTASACPAASTWPPLALWIVVATLGALSGAGATLALGLRRRRHLRPRALDLGR